MQVKHRQVLAITKRRAQLCGTQSLLQASGIELLDAPSMRSARQVINESAVKGVIVCMHSWSERERDQMVTELESDHPELSVIVRCPGCSECDPAAKLERPGVLCTVQPFLQFLSL
jgi:hypothetical protein